MTKDDVLFGYRLQLFDLAGRTTVSHACRTFGVHRSTYYRWKAQVDRQGLEMLRPRERRRPIMPNQLPLVVEERIVAFSLGLATVIYIVINIAVTFAMRRVERRDRDHAVGGAIKAMRWRNAHLLVIETCDPGQQPVGPYHGLRHGEHGAAEQR